MLNLCLVVISSHFSETKEREIAKMKLYRLQHSSSVSTGSQLMGSKSKSLYSQIIGFISHYYRRSKRLVIAQYNAYRARKDETSSNRNSANTNGQVELQSNGKLTANYRSNPVYSNNESGIRFNLCRL